jgi:hypothetical protein
MLRANSVISLAAVREALLDAEAIRRMAERYPLRYWEWMRAHSAARDRARAFMRGNGELRPLPDLARLEWTNRSPLASLPLPDEAHPVSGVCLSRRASRGSQDREPGQTSSVIPKKPSAGIVLVRAQGLGSHHEGDHKPNWGGQRHHECQQ